MNRSDHRPLKILDHGVDLMASIKTSFGRVRVQFQKGLDICPCSKRLLPSSVQDDSPYLLLPLIKLHKDLRDLLLCCHIQGIHGGMINGDNSHAISNFIMCKSFTHRYLSSNGLMIKSLFYQIVFERLLRNEDQFRR